MSKGLKLVVISVFILFSSLQPVFAQAPTTEKRIYLIDLTGSMEGRGSIQTPNILQTVKDNLAATIENIEDPLTEIIIIPFNYFLYTYSDDGINLSLLFNKLIMITSFISLLSFNNILKCIAPLHFRSYCNEGSVINPDEGYIPAI